MSLNELLPLDRLLIDGKRPGDVTGAQITVSKDGDNLCTVFFNVEGKARVTTVETEAITFGDA